MIEVDTDGRVQFVLPPHAGFAWRADPARSAATGPATRARLTLRQSGQTSDALMLEGDARGQRDVRLVLDGDLSTAVAVRVDGAGRWRAALPTQDLVDAPVQHRVVAYAADSGAVSSPLMFRARREWVPMADVDDPTGDDTGPTGRYVYPDDAGWRALHPGDIERVQAFASAGALRLDVTMRALTRAWNPANGFDHVALTVYIELPGVPGGIAAMPLQDASLPAGMRWQRRLRVGGWSNVLTTSAAADAGHEGSRLAPAATLAVDEAGRTVRLTLPARVLGALPHLDGARVYVTSWDYDGGYRPLAPAAGAHSFGGAAADAPKVLDDTLLVLRAPRR